MTEDTKNADSLRDIQLRVLRNIATDESVQERFIEESLALMGIQKHREKYIGQYIFAVDREPADLNDHAVNVGNSTVTGFSYLNNWLKGHFVDNVTKVEWSFLLLAPTLLTIESELAARRGDSNESLSVSTDLSEDVQVSQDVASTSDRLTITGDALVTDDADSDEVAEFKSCCNSGNCCKCCACGNCEKCKN